MTNKSLSLTNGDNSPATVYVTSSSADYYSAMAAQSAKQAGQYLKEVKEISTSAINTLTSTKEAALSDLSLEKQQCLNDLQLLIETNNIDTTVQIAKDWACKIDESVDGEEYSAKYYAQIAKGKCSLESEYQNGTSWYEIYSNKSLIQGGQATEGSSVVFLKPFADTNYTLTIPYSSKTESGFTSSASGDYIAYGKSSI